jgi:acyl-CoA oxidase
MNSRLVLSRAVTIAVRYLAIRRQFRDQDSPDLSGPETAVLDYSTVQIRVLPLLATVFALHYTGKAMWELYERTRTAHNLDSDNSKLAELHSTSAGLKSLATDLSANGIETCRRAMGGHGFGGATGLVQINADWLSKPTVEGDNWMITQQVARYLLKMMGQVTKGILSAGQSQTVLYLRDFHQRGNSALPCSIYQNDAEIVRAFEHRVAFQTWKAYKAREIEKVPWNDLLIDFHNLSRAYSQALLIRNFYEALQTFDLDPLTAETISDLFHLFSFYTIDAEQRFFQASGAVSSTDTDGLGGEILRLMKRIRPHAVKLVDSFSIPDYLLDSALGRYDGKVYETLFDLAHRKNPLNKETFNPRYWEDEIVLGSGDGGKVVAKL